MTRYYIDACVWRDYFEDRRDGLRPLGEWAFQLLKKIVDEEDVVVISDHLIDELRKYLSDEQVNTVLEIIPEELKLRFHDGPEQQREAHRIGAKLLLHKSDALHLVIALETEALLISRDHNFDHIKNRFYIYKPEELI